MPESPPSSLPLLLYVKTTAEERVVPMDIAADRRETGVLLRRMGIPSQSLTG